MPTRIRTLTAITALAFSPAIASAQATTFPGNVTLSSNTPSILLQDTASGGKTYSLSSRWGGYFTIFDEGDTAEARLSIRPGGWTGINKTLPDARLHIFDGTGTGPGLIVQAGYPYGAGVYPSILALKDKDGSNNLFNVNSDGSFFFNRGPDRVLTGAANGNVGIGITTPPTRLSLVSSDADFSTGMSFGRTATGNGKYVLTNSDNNVFRIGFAANWGTSHSDYVNRLVIDPSGNIGIGTTNPQHKLAVNGTIKAKEVIVETTGWSDYVFADDYALAPLAEVEAHIKEHKHLPGIPSAAQVAEQGVSLGDMQAKLLAKIEELTLHVIAQQKHSADQERRLTSRVETLEAENRRLKARFEQLEVR